MDLDFETHLPWNVRTSETLAPTFTSTLIRFILPST
jgi:hypothetical protein